LKFVVVQRTGESYPPQSFAEALRALDGLLFKSAKRDDLLLPGPSHWGSNMIPLPVSNAR
jgi:hypothetical protein